MPVARWQYQALVEPVLPPATLYTVTQIGGATFPGSTTFQLVADGATNALVSISKSNPSDTITSTPVMLNGLTPVTYVVTWSSTGTRSFGFINNGGLTNPANLLVTVSGGAAVPSLPGWLPVYPDLFAPTKRQSDNSSAFVELVPAALTPLTWLPTYPDRVVTATRAIQAAQAFVPLVGSSPAPLLSWQPTFPNLLQPLPRLPQSGISAFVRLVAAAVATTYTFTGPTTLAAGATGTYTLTGNGTTSAAITISDGGAGGTIITSPVTLNGTTGVTFTYSNNTPQTLTLTPTNAAGLINPAGIVVTITPSAPFSATVTGTMEAGTGTFVNIPAGGSVIIMGPIQTPFREGMRDLVDVAANGAFHLNYQYTTDGGTTWYTGKQVVSSTTTADGTAYTNSARIKVATGFQWEIILTNTTGSVISAAWDKRLFDKGKRST